MTIPSDNFVPVGPARDGIDLSIVIVNWNTREILRNCLASVRRDAVRIGCETIIVDNHSSDGSADMVASEFPEMTLIRNEDNKGFASANNQGIVISRGRYILLLNPDTIVRKDALARSVSFADRHPRAAIVGCRTYGHTGCMQYNCYQFPNLLNLALSLSHLQIRFFYHPFWGRARLGWWDYNTPREVEAVAGCFMLARREAVQEVGPMSEEYFMYSEDTEWCWRFHQAGWKVMYTPDAEILHYGQLSSSQVATDMRLMERRSLLMFLEKKSGKWARRFGNIMFCGATIAKVPLLLMKRVVKKGRRPDSHNEMDVCLAAIRYHLFGQLPGKI